MEVQTLNISEVKLNPNNPRLVKDDKFKQLVKSIQDFPQMLNIRPIVVNDDMIVLGGNMRLKACKEAGLKKVPVIKASELTEDQQREFIIKDNVGFGEWDWDMIANEWSAEQLEDWGLDIPDFSSNNRDVKESEEENVDDVVTDILPGDLFEIGSHRLLCGDSTSSEDVAKLMNGEKADLVFTDPPYGVNVKGGKSKKNMIEGDLTQTAIPFSFEICVKQATKERAWFYFCGGESNIGLYFKLFERYLKQMPKLLIWVKNGFVMRQNGYHGQYELIFCGFKEGGGAKWFGGRTEDEASDVWQVKRDSTSEYLHPTQKPIELPSRAIRNHSSKGDLVFEPFGGSGSTLSAAHQLGRKCYTMEYDPKYVSIILKRLKNLDNSLEIKCLNRNLNMQKELSDD